MYQTLRDGLIADDLLSGQPKFAQEHLKEVLIGGCLHMQALPATLFGNQQRRNTKHGDQHSSCVHRSSTITCLAGSSTAEWLWQTLSLPQSAQRYCNSRVGCNQLTFTAASDPPSLFMQEPSQDDIFRANVLGWCIEWVGTASHCRPPSSMPNPHQKSCCSCHMSRQACDTDENLTHLPVHAVAGFFSGCR